MRSTHLWAKGRWVPRLGYRFYGHLPMFSAQLSSRGSQPSDFSAAADQCTSATIAARISAQATTPCHGLSLCFMLEFLASDALRHIIGHTRFGTCPVLRLAVRATGPGGSSFGLSPVSPMIGLLGPGSLGPAARPLVVLHFVQYKTPSLSVASNSFPQLQSFIEPP
jgi:hypothetical protein